MKKFYVIGDPISQSKSPQMHMAAFLDCKIAASYEAMQVRENELKDWVQSFLSDKNSVGFNVTIPHKTTICNYLDEISDLATAIGAVNTVVKTADGKMVGHNTDGVGYLRGLELLLDDKNISNLAILIVGAGGAARAIYYTLRQNGCCDLTIASRTIDKAMEISSKSYTLSEIKEQLAHFDVIINTTPVGMGVLKTKVPLKLLGIKKDTIISDIIYNPKKTLWLLRAEALGCKIQNGLEMFVNQGAEAFKIWTQKTPNILKMKEAIIND